MQSVSSLRCEDNHIDHHLLGPQALGGWSGVGVLVEGNGCAESYEDLDVDGKFAIVRRGLEGLSVKAEAARDAGAVALAIYQQCGDINPCMDGGRVAWWDHDPHEIPILFVSEANALRLADKLVVLEINQSCPKYELNVECLVQDIDAACEITPPGNSLIFGSKEAPLAQIGMHMFTLHVYPNGLDESDRDWLALYLKRVDDNPIVQFYENLKLDVSFHSLPSRNEFWTKSLRFEDEIVPSNLTSNINSRVGWGSERCFRTNEFREAGKKWLVHLHLSASAPAKPSWKPVCHRNRALLKSIGNDMDLADVTIKVDGCDLRSFSHLLCGRSPVFKAMLQGKMEEAGSKEISVEDFGLCAVQDMVEFIHTCNVTPEVLQDISRAGELLRAAKKYVVNDLVEYIEHDLANQLNHANCAHILVVAERSGSIILRQSAMQFLTKDFDTLQQAQEAKEFDELSADVVREILNKAHNHRKRRSSGAREFPDGSDWQRLSLAQLRRACIERGLPDEGSRTSLLRTLSASESA